MMKLTLLMWLSCTSFRCDTNVLELIYHISEYHVWKQDVLMLRYGQALLLETIVIKAY